MNRSRTANDQARGKRHLSRDEVTTICQTIRNDSRYPDRDEALVLVAFHHGLRVSETTALRWQHLDLKTGTIAIKRVKEGISNTPPIFDKRELMLLRRLHRKQNRPTTGHVFKNQRGGAVSVNSVQQLVNRHSVKALGVKWNAHALRHGCGTAMVDADYHIRKVQNWLGHVNIQNTCLYLHESAKQFDDVEF
jgi:integrase